MIGEYSEIERVNYILHKCLSSLSYRRLSGVFHLSINTNCEVTGEKEEFKLRVYGKFLTATFCT